MQVAQQVRASGCLHWPLVLRLCRPGRALLLGQDLSGVLAFDYLAKCAARWWSSIGPQGEG